MKAEERLCFICNTNGIEDEQHFICVCNEYSQLREIMFSKVHNLKFNLMSNKEKLVYLTNHHWKELSIFLKKHGIKEMKFCIHRSMAYCHAC